MIKYIQQRKAAKAAEATELKKQATFIRAMMATSITTYRN